MSLVLIDEIGANCAPEISLPFQWAISEKLLSLPQSIALLVTHNMWMQQLLQYACTFSLSMHKYKIAYQEIDVTELDSNYFDNKEFYKKLIEKRSRLG